MGTSAIPAIVDALVTQATAGLADRLVVDGYAATDNANPNVLMIGVDNPDTQFAAQSSDTSQDAGPMGTTRPRDQRGSVTCAALSWSGSTDQKAARDAAYATLAAVEALLRADPKLGLSSFPYLVAEMGDERLSQNQYDDGVDALLIFSVKFRARL